MASEGVRSDQVNRVVSRAHHHGVSTKLRWSRRQNSQPVGAWRGSGNARCEKCRVGAGRANALTVSRSSRPATGRAELRGDQVAGPGQAQAINGGSGSPDTAAFGIVGRQAVRGSVVRRRGRLRRPCAPAGAMEMNARIFRTLAARTRKATRTLWAATPWIRRPIVEHCSGHVCGAPGTAGVDRAAPSGWPDVLINPVPRLSGDDEVERVDGRRPGFEWRDDDVHPASVGHGGHSLVRFHADNLAPAIEKQLRRNAGAAPDVQDPSDVRAVDLGIDCRCRVRRSRAVVLLGVVAER